VACFAERERLFAESFLELSGFRHQLDTKLLQGARQFVAPAIPGHAGASFRDTAQIFSNCLDHRNRGLLFERNA
jgi:hypothetical protein